MPPRSESCCPESATLQEVASARRSAAPAAARTAASSCASVCAALDGRGDVEKTQAAFASQAPELRMVKRGLRYRRRNRRRFHRELFGRAPDDFLDLEYQGQAPVSQDCLTCHSRDLIEK